MGKCEREKVAERLNAFVGSEDGRLEPLVMLSLSQASHRSGRMLIQGSLSNKVTNTLMQRTLFYDVCKHMCSRWYTPDFNLVITDI